MISPVFDALADKVYRMIELGIIEVCDGSEWLNRNVIVRKPGKNRLSLIARQHYLYTRMPFALCNAAQRMCKLMDKIIGVSPPKNCLNG